MKQEFSSRIRGRAAAAIGLCAVAAILILTNLLWKTVAADEKPYPWAGLHYGYKIEKPWGWRNAFRITLYGYRFSIRLETSGTVLNRVTEQRWLCDNRTVYIYISGWHDFGSYGLNEPGKIIYDFDRGEMYTYGASWIVGSPENWQKRFTKEEEFDQVLHRLEHDCHH